jgi:CHAT domain-containing protein/tetratricopeptide (TPR) repeat protein
MGTADQFKYQLPQSTGEAKAAPPEGSTFRLEPSAPVVSRIVKDTGDTYEFDLVAGQYVHLLVAKEGDLNLFVSAYGPDGQALVERPSRSYGDLHISVIAEASGRYSLTIRSLERDATRKHYALRIKELRAATVLDKNNAAAGKSFAEAEKLRAEWKEGDLRRAVEKYNQAFALWQSTSQNREATVALESIGEIYCVLSEYSTALDYFRKMLAMSRLVGDRSEEIKAFNNIGYVYIYLGQNSVALPYFKKALARCKALQGATQGSGGRHEEAQALNNTGEVYYSLGDLKKALDLFNRALTIWLATGDRRGQALSHLNIGYTYYDMGDAHAASDHYQQSLSLWRAIDEHRGEALARTALGGVYSFVGERQLALDAHTQAVQVLRAVGDHQGEAAALNGIGRVYEESNKTDTALDNYNGALELYQKIGNRDYEALTECYVGRVYRSRGSLLQALDHYHRSVFMSRAVADRRIEAYALKEIGMVYSAQGDKRRALGQYEEVMKLYRKFGDRRGQAQTLNAIGLIYQSSAHGQKALGYYRQALSLNLAGADRASEAATRYNIARAAREANLLPESLTQIKNSVKIIDALRAHIASYELRSSYFALMYEYYGFYIDLLMQLHKKNPLAYYSATAFEASESARARSLLELLMETKGEIREGVPADLLARERNLQQDLNARAKYHLRLMNSKSTEDQAAELEREIRQLTTEYEEVEARIRETSPRYAELTQPQLLRLEDVQTKLLDDQTILLEYALGSDRSYLWMVTPTSFESYELPDRAKIEDAARVTYQLLTARQPVAGDTFTDYQKRVADSDTLFTKQALLLSQMILGPVAAKISNKRLLIVADGALQYVPFEALPMPDSKPPEGPVQGVVHAASEPAPLVLNHEIVGLPSASTLLSLRQGKARVGIPAKIVAVFADPVFEQDDPRVQITGRPTGTVAEKPSEAVGLRNVLRESEGWNKGSGIPRLPSTLIEGKAIMALIPRDQGALASGFDASRARAMSGELGSYQILHFATHVVVNNEHPELSGIILSMVNRQGVPENGFLQLHDIYNLKLSAELVVLSACETGLGQDVKGEGLIGLTRGFMYAGSKSTIASLWKVDDDATAELMGYFYKALLQDGMPPAAALRTAKEKMWKQQRWHEPFYWAAFVMQGEYKGNIKANIKANSNALSAAAKIMILIGVFLSLIGALYAKKRITRNIAARRAAGMPPTTAEIDKGPHRARDLP